MSLKFVFCKRHCLFPKNDYQSLLKKKSQELLSVVYKAD